MNMLTIGFKLNEIAVARENREKKLRSYLTAQYGELEMIPVKYVEFELLLTKSEAKSISSAVMQKGMLIPRKKFIDLIVNELYR